MSEYEITSIDSPALVTIMYQDISPDYKIDKLDTSYFDYVRGDDISCPRLKAVWQLLVDNFNIYYATREIGGMSEYDFFCMMQSCLNRNADTLERHLMVYDDDIANPILGRTEVVTYDTLDKRDSDLKNEINYGSKVSRTEDGEDLVHHVEVPAETPEYDTDRSRDRTEYGHTTEDENSGKDNSSSTNDESRKMTGTVKTELSDIGVRPNYESLNGFLDNNRTFIQEFINIFEECFSPRYRRVFF